MFKCQKCHFSFQKRYTLIESARSVNYTNIILDKYKKSENKRIESQGWEIEREIYLCQSCYQHSLAKPRQLKASGKIILNYQYR